MDRTAAKLSGQYSFGSGDDAKFAKALWGRAAILIAKGDADDQRRASLARLAEVDQPDLTAPGRRYLLRRAIARGRRRPR